MLTAFLPGHVLLRWSGVIIQHLDQLGTWCRTGILGPNIEEVAVCQIHLREVPFIVVIVLGTRMM